MWLFWAYVKIFATQLLKLDSLKSNCSKHMSNLLSLMNPLLYLPSTTCAHPCYFSTPSDCSKVARKIDEDTGVTRRLIEALGIRSPSQPSVRRMDPQD